MSTYNGWTNYETWNVALWIGNDEGLYSLAKDFRNRGYTAFAEFMRELADDTSDATLRETPDGVSWTDSGLDIAELDELLAEL